MLGEATGCPQVDTIPLCVVRLSVQRPVELPHTSRSHYIKKINFLVTLNIKWLKKKTSIDFTDYESKLQSIPNNHPHLLRRSRKCFTRLDFHSGQRFKQKKTSICLTSVNVRTTCARRGDWLPPSGHNPTLRCVAIGSKTCRAPPHIPLPLYKKNQFF